MQRGAAAAIASGVTARAVMASPHWMKNGTLIERTVDLTDFAEMKKFALKAVDSAKAAGAVYADVRLTLTAVQGFKWQSQQVIGAGISDTEELSIGIRALVNGYWGFSASPYWDLDEIDLLAKDAVAQAKTNALGTPRVVDMGKVPVATGTWVTPGIDPFTITIEEKLDLINGWRQSVADHYVADLGTVPGRDEASFSRQDCFFASTEGSAVGQTFYTVNGSWSFAVLSKDWRNSYGSNVSATGLNVTRNGWNVFVDAHVRDQIPKLIESTRAEKIPTQPGDIGRYDVVFDASTTAGIIAGTFASATQLDRALGYEANADGTSYLGPDPFDHLGTGLVAADSVTISGNRSMPGGNATVKWDDEGVEPDDFNIVEKGVLVDYQTTREQASWLKPWYDKRGKPVRSHGCMQTSSGLGNPVQMPPNLVMKPADNSNTFESMVAGTKKGLAIMGGGVSTDFQSKNGVGGGTVREIVNGKLGPIWTGSSFLFNSAELWKNVTEIGGVGSESTRASGAFKGQPGQQSVYSISAVPMAVKNISIVDRSRRA